VPRCWRLPGDWWEPFPATLERKSQQGSPLPRGRWQRVASADISGGEAISCDGHRSTRKALGTKKMYRASCL
jgi:hypothetical protein